MAQRARLVAPDYHDVRAGRPGRGHTRSSGSEPFVCAGGYDATSEENGLTPTRMSDPGAHGRPLTTDQPDA
jgi:hypothetical protein